MENGFEIVRWMARCGGGPQIESGGKKAMCGICGKLNFDSSRSVSGALLKSMADAIEHRGPDDEGYYYSGSVGFGFRRLSIIDLNTGHQPICNEDETVWIVFNGEIYNYQDLRQDLQSRGHIFKSRTDTEVIIHLYEEYGVGCLEKLRGMFAFAIWDETKKELLLARDRVGIKPLYYCLSDRSLVFGSEIKALLADPEVEPEVVPEMIDRFLTFLYVPGEETLLRNVHKLAPGSYLISREGKTEIKKYWDLQFSPQSRTEAQAKEELLALLEDSVRLHMISDVPVGFLLSGGVDSTAMLGFAVGKTDKPLSSYTLGFSAPGIIDERPYATLAAQHFGTEHHETTISSQEFVDFLPRFAWHMEEPVCEPQAVALYYVSRLARKHVKVLISGEGGDEAFAGYQTYRGVLWLERLKTALGPFANMAGRGAAYLDRALEVDRLHKYAPLLSLAFDDYYYGRTYAPRAYFNSQFSKLYSRDFAGCVNKDCSVAPARAHLHSGRAKSVLNRMLYTDTKTSLPDDLLLKADKMTMANSVELRVPLLDHKILEFAASLPENFKIRGFTTKYLAKSALRSRVPREILDRKKAGFPVPYENWLRTELKAWLQDVLLDRETTARGYFDRSSIEGLIAENSRSGKYSKELLSLAVLELWHRSFVTGSNPKAGSTASKETAFVVGG
jgi:asparagine synthase (glutamine-hydrolysing)